MDVHKLVQEMTLEEKASLCSGRIFGIQGRGAAGNPSDDGLRRAARPAQAGSVRRSPGHQRQHQGRLLPTAAGLACSFDRELLFRVGEALGKECQAEDVGVILGPAANIKRSPLCGRNFEYFSEDPYLSGEMAAAHIRGVQSRNVGTSLKHFAVNNQETRRMSVDARVDERTQREIYLASFEGAVKGGRPWTVCALTTGLTAPMPAENPRLLTGILPGTNGALTGSP